MPIQLDHLILKVNDLPESVAFYRDVLGLTAEGRTGPFEVLRVTPELTLQLAPWGTQGGEHLAFAFEAAEFDAAFARIQATGVAYGDRFHTAENMRGPGEEDGARGPGRTLYLFDPNRHLIEIRSY